MSQPDHGQARAPALHSVVPTFNLLAAAFICGWALMSVEILGGRILAPDFGSGIFTWGSLISTFLVALSVGYLVGGWMSSRRPSLGMLVAIMAVAGILVLALPVGMRPVCEAIFRMDLGERVGPLVASLALFTLPGIVLGMVSPYCVHLGARGLDTVGMTSGSLYAVSTVGSTLGTLMTTFFLIPSMGVTSILLLNGGGILALALLLGLSDLQRARRLQPVAAAVAVCWLCCLPALADERVIWQQESTYTRIMVTQEGSVRVLRFARKGVNTEESRVDIKAPLHMLNEYTEIMFAGLALVPDPHDVLVIGLGGGIVPRSLRHYYAQTHIDNVELDAAVIETARNYFLFRTDPLMSAIASDGRVYVKRCRLQYDMVFLDAFQGRDIPFHLKTKEFFGELQRIVRPGGVVVSNLHRGPRLYSSERRTYAAAFPTNYGFGGQRSGNMIVVSSQSPAIPKNELLARATRLQAAKHFDFDLVAQVRKLVEKPDWDANAAVLTDDYAPVEILNSK